MRQVQAILLCWSAEHDVVLSHHKATGVEVEETTEKEHVGTQQPSKSSDIYHSHNDLSEDRHGKEGKNNNLEDDVDIDKTRPELSHSVNHQRNQCNKTQMNDDRYH